MSHLKKRGASAIVRALRSSSPSPSFWKDWMFTSGANFLLFPSPVRASIVASGKDRLPLQAVESAIVVLGFQS